MSAVIPRYKLHKGTDLRRLQDQQRLLIQIGQAEAQIPEAPSLPRD